MVLVYILLFTALSAKMSEAVDPGCSFTVCVQRREYLLMNLYGLNVAVFSGSMVMNIRTVF